MSTAEKKNTQEQINVEPAGNLQIIHGRQVLGKAFFIQSFEECLYYSCFKRQSIFRSSAI